MQQAALALATAPDFLAATLVSALATEHKGRANGVSAAALASKLGVNERTLRHLVSAAREDGIAVAGTPSTGYYMAQSADELEECCRFLRARAMHSLVIESRLRKVPLAELVGQLQLSTL